MVRQAGAVDNGVQSSVNSIGPSCKMWFPMTETSGSTFADLAASTPIVITPTAIAFGLANAVQFYHEVTAPPTSGTLPSPGTKDFIFFTVCKTASFGRGIGQINVGDAINGPSYGTSEIDAIYLDDGVTTEEINDSNGAGGNDNTALALVRTGDRIKNWHEWEGFSNNGPGEYIIGTTSNGLDYKIAPTGSVDVTNTIKFHKTGASVTNAPSYFGIAMWVFDDGLPGDTETALLWMMNEWRIGNKVLYPGWSSV